MTAAKLAHRFDGPGDGPVLVLASSLGATNRMWESQVPALAERFRVLRYDTRGHGESDVTPGPYTVGDLGEDVLALLDELGIERVSFCGLSLGGLTGMWLARNAPGRIDRLVLSSAHIPPAEMWTERARVVRADGTAEIAEAVVGRWFTPMFAEAHPDVVAAYRAMVASTPPEGYASCAEAVGAWDFRSELAKISAPTLVIAGAEDPATPPEHGRYLAEHIAGARLVVLDAAAHLANVEQPEAFTAAVLDFLTKPL